MGSNIDSSGHVEVYHGSRSIHISGSTLDNAVHELMRRAKLVGEEDRDPSLDSSLILAKHVTLPKYTKWNESERQGVICELVDGMIIAKELTSDPHGAAISDVIVQIGRQDVNDLLWMFVNLDKKVGPRTIYAVDFVIAPRIPRQPNQIAPTRSDPTIYVEVGVAQSLKDLCNKSNEYLTPNSSIQCYLVLKRYEYRMNGTQAMVAVLFSRNGPNGMNFPISIISFGSAPLYSTVTSWINHASRGWGGVCRGVGFANDPPCNVLNLPLYRIDCPSNSVFVGLPAIPNGALANYSLDLFRIQECFNLPL